MKRAAAALLAATLVLAGCDSGGGDGDDRAGGGAGGDGRRPAPTGEPTPPTGNLTVVSLNLLHGAFCPEETAGCRAAERATLFLSQLDGPCPDVVALQEVDARLLDAVRRGAGDVCGGVYEVVWHGEPGLDRELVLSRLPVEAHELVGLVGGLRSAYWVRLGSPLGPVDLVVTHLASRDNPPCDAERCPPPCTASGDTRTCQARQVADILAERRHPESVAVVAGDLNAAPGSPPLVVLEDAGLLDAHRAAGNAECDPVTGVACTSGRADDDLTDLTDPTARQSERIDYVLVAPPPGCEPDFDGADDPDGDGVPTGPFAPGPEGGPGGLAFASDHTAVALDFSCT